MAKILVALEDRDLALNVRTVLEGRGFDVVLVFGGLPALTAIRDERPDLLVLGLLLPGLTGLDIWRRVAAEPETSALPILFLSGRARDPEAVVGVAIGPGLGPAVRFEYPDLAGTAEAALARVATLPALDVVRAGPVVVDLRRSQVTVHARAVRLTSREFALLRALLDARGHVRTRERLLHEVWGAGDVRPARLRAVDVYVQRLRAKLAPEGRRIVTVRNVGYRFAVTVDWILFGGETPPQSPVGEPGTA